jgi:hypothetical protein
VTEASLQILVDNLHTCSGAPHDSVGRKRVRAKLLHDPADMGGGTCARPGHTGGVRQLRQSLRISQMVLERIPLVDGECERRSEVRDLSNAGG